MGDRTQLFLGHDAEQSAVDPAERLAGDRRTALFPVASAASKPLALEHASAACCLITYVDDLFRLAQRPFVVKLALLLYS